LVLEAILVLVAVAEVDLRAVKLEADLGLDDLHQARGDPICEKRTEALGAFDVVLGEIVADATEHVDLQAWEGIRPEDCESPHEVRLAATGGATVEDFGGWRSEDLTLLRVQLDVDGELGTQALGLRSHYPNSTASYSRGLYRPAPRGVNSF
jgi:hypothetical protein